MDEKGRKHKIVYPPSLNRNSPSETISREMQFRDTILLTGAGFTANFGGFLAKEMWSKIFNNPKLNEAKNLKLELRNNFDFEEVYSKVLGNQIKNLNPSEYNVFVESLNEAYLAMDKVIRNSSSETYGTHPADLRRFLNFFRESGEQKIATCFTLNQDLFMERNFGWQPLGPSAMRFNGNFGNLDLKDLDSDQLKRLPNQDELEAFKSSLSEGFYYIKLHGSQKWIAPDGRDTKILGINKREAINRIPLLKWYFELFEQILFRKNTRLVVIGYSFRDDHVNECIVKAVNEYGLSLYVISTEDPDKFSFRMRHKYPSGSALNEVDNKKLAIWNAIEGYFPYKLKRILPHPQRTTAEKVEVFNSIGIPLTT